MGPTTAAAVEEVTGGGGQWRARIRAGVLPGRIGLRVEIPGYPAATTAVTAVLDTRDSAADGMPDAWEQRYGLDPRATDASTSAT